MPESAIRYTNGTVPDRSSEYTMPTLVKTPSGSWKAVIRKNGFPTTIKTFRLKRDAEDWARRTEDEMVRGLFIQRTPAERSLMATQIPPPMATSNSPTLAERR
jgi:hypothetical protein